MTAGRGKVLVRTGILLVVGALLGWGMAAVFAWDLLGEAWRTAAVFGGGGALALLLMATQARRRGRGVLSRAPRGSVAAIAAVGSLATSVLLVRYVYLYAEGAVPLWPMFYCLGLLVVVAVLMFVVVFNAIAAGAAWLRRRRGSEIPAGAVRRLLTEWAAAVLILASNYMLTTLFVK